MKGLRLSVLPSFVVLYLLMVLPSECFAASHYPSRESSFIDSVDYYLQRASLYTHRALSEINDELDSLDYMPVSERLIAMAKIGQRLEQIDIDSAMMIYNRGEELALKNNDKRYLDIFRYRKGSVMPLMGLVREGIELYTSINPAELDNRDKLDYFSTGRHMFDAAVDYYHVDSLKTKYKYLAGVYNDSALAYVKPGSVEALYYQALPKLGGNDAGDGINDLRKVLDRVEVNDPIFAKAAAEIASVYSRKNDLVNAKYFLALSAIGDLKAGTREATSLHRLGKLLSNEDDYTRAYDYLTYALESAVASGSSLRTLEIGEIMPVVAKSGREIERKQNKSLTVIVFSLSIAVIIFVCILIYAFWTRRRLTHARKQLVDINDSKDLYIRKLISLCGAYLQALENFNVLAGRKIKVGQINDLMAMIESGKVIREQLQSFYEVFDDAFLAVYPDFVERVNALLLPDKQLSLTDDGRLGTELRIIAFMRLGMEDSNQISKFLGLSLNTIYTYRNKVKTRAKDRMTFEESVRNIGREV